MFLRAPKSLEKKHMVEGKKEGKKRKGRAGRRGKRCNVARAKEQESATEREKRGQAASHNPSAQRGHTDKIANHCSCAVVENRGKCRKEEYLLKDEYLQRGIMGKGQVTRVTIPERNGHTAKVTRNASPTEETAEYVRNKKPSENSNWEKEIGDKPTQDKSVCQLSSQIPHFSFQPLVGMSETSQKIQKTEKNTLG